MTVDLACTCVDTLHGLARAGCSVHDPEADEAPCNPSAPCKAEYQSDDDLCCTHGGMCTTSSHAHHDAEEYAEYLIDNYLDRQAETWGLR